MKEIDKFPDHYRASCVYFLCKHLPVKSERLNECFREIQDICAKTFIENFTVALQSALEYAERQRALPPFLDAQASANKALKELRKVALAYTQEMWKARLAGD
ncbi:MAG: hypothetical protein H7240_08810 [Glaciimonas sp.]|nr:hypothetical protein [Glaciimonas sp.]